MGPIALFDKSFLQSLTEDESVWFDNYFLPIICPLFYVETLADLGKNVRGGRTPENEVNIIARKFPERNAHPCSHHRSLGMLELLGHYVPMRAQIPMSGGRSVELNGKSGVLFDESPEAEAFSRWQRNNFSELERGIARNWRAELSALDLESIAKPLREIGISPSTCKSLENARDLARSVVSGQDKHFQRMQLAIEILEIPRHYYQQIMQRWSLRQYPSLANYAPYLAHIVSVELFFQFALAAHQISSERASNRVDIAYLHYLPFCHVFVSNDKLHRRCAPHFLRKDQDFVWGLDLKEDLKRINDHFMAYPDSEKERGIINFAATAPNIQGSITRRLRARFLSPGYDDRAKQRPPPKEDPKSQELVRMLKEWRHAPETMNPSEIRNDPEMLSVAKRVHKRKGSWWQLPKNLPDDTE